MSFVSDYGIPIFMLISMALQSILTILGSFRKRCSKKWFTLLLWSAYQLADVVATSSLGMISSYGVDNDIFLYSLSPSFLWHLGGPDSITAFSLVDNELCFRHSLQLVYRVAVVGYVQVKIFLLVTGRSKKVTRFMLRWIAWPMILFLAGISKYGERTWALHSANMNYLRDSMLPPANPGPRPLIFNDEDNDDNDVVNAQSITTPMPMDEYASGMATTSTPAEGTLLEEQLDSSEVILLRGYHYFCNFRYLFVDLMVPYSYITDCQRFFLQYPCEVAFQLVDVELSFVYDMLFTKAPVVHTRLACTLRLLRIVALLYYSISTTFSDILNTLILVQEMYEVIQMILSEWTVVWLNNHSLNWVSTRILRLILSCRLLVPKIICLCSCGVKEVTSETTTIWWHNNIMPQYNLLSFCFKAEPTMFNRILSLSTWGKSIQEWVEKTWNTTYMHVPNSIKDFIYQQLKEMVQTTDKEIRSAEFHNPRGKWVMERNNCQEHNCLEELSWSVDVEFDRSILIWHVATDLCYYHDDLSSDKCEATTLLQVQVSKALSNYLLYLLLIYPFTLNNRIGKIRFQDTCATMKKLFDAMKDKKQMKSKPFSSILQRKKSSIDEKQAKGYIIRLLTSDSQVLIRETKSGESKSVFLEAHRLAKLLQLYEKEKKWKILSGVWVEMLSYAASNCSGKHHAERLCDGGEFITKIWLLMAHLGISLCN